MTSCHSYALLTLSLKVAKWQNSQSTLIPCSWLGPNTREPWLVNRQSKRPMFLEQTKNKNVRRKNVSGCPIMAASVTFLSTLLRRCQGPDKGPTQCNPTRGRVLLLPIIISLFTLKLKPTGRAQVSNGIPHNSDYASRMQYVKCSILDRKSSSRGVFDSLAAKTTPKRYEIEL